MKRAFAFVMLVGCGGAPAATTPVNDTRAAPEATQSTSTANESPQVAAARGDLDRAESQIGSSPSDCVTACRALQSMERAAEHLCELDSGGECGRARERVQGARERVRASCGGCGS